MVTCNHSRALPANLTLMTPPEPASSSSPETGSEQKPHAIDFKAVSDHLITWFSDAARDLPWRQERSGYHALVSEAMLQQTQVDRVIPAYLRFLERFPTIEALANAPEESVMASWQGLGYYRRARSLQAAAVRVLEDFGGEIPRTAKDLKTLPGVGRYTAGAVASIVFGERAAIVDGNVARVLARLAANHGRPGERSFDVWTWEQAEVIAKTAGDPGVANEALMELGALVCTRHTPDCEHCPLKAECAGLAEGEPARIPEPRKVGPRKLIHLHVVLVRREDTVLLYRRPDRGLWAGMWEPPTVESNVILDPEQLISRLDVNDVETVHPVETFEHRTTHRDVVFHVHRSDIAEPVAGSEHRWHPLNALDEIGLSNPHRRLIDRFSAAGSSG
jgi:A/G-specific adenine glycosylase